MELKGKKGDFDYAQSPKHLPENLRNPNGADRCLSGVDRCLSGVEGSGYKQTEIGVIPEDWEIKNLDEIGQVLVGLTYSPEQVREFGTLVLRSSNIQSNSLAFENNVFVDMQLPERVIVKKDDILICVRNGSRSLIGKCALITKSVEGSAFGAFMAIYRTKNSKYVFSAFQSNIIQKQIENNLGATINQITNKDLKSFLIPLPPLPEQQKIAEALSDTDALIQSLKKLIAKKKDIKQGAMQELLSGKRRLEGFDGEWENVKLGSIATFLKGKSLSKSQLIVNGKHKCIHYGELFTFYKETITEIKSRTDLPITENTFLSQNNDILMPTSDVTPNGLATASCINEEKVIIGGDVLVIRAHKQKLNGTFFSYIVSISKEKIMQLVSGSTVYHLYGSDMAKFEFNFPVEISEQTRIAQILTDMDAEIEALEKQLQKTELLKQGMMQELLTGRIRLVKPQAEMPAMVAEPTQNYKTH
ncbi:restriction endonuclease subunit S [Elizabethkingia anophelis]|uniref:restriction endonuclease subunit S n=1 Tax=Elizabethkingia anophelis TaxID=1117645 RepID=UPI0021A2C0C4